MHECLSTALPYSQLPLSDAGEITDGQISGSTLFLRYRLNTRVAQLMLVVYAEGSVLETTILKTNRGQHTLHRDLSATKNIEAITLVVVESAQPARLPPTGTAIDLDRLLSRNLSDVNRNLRWPGRIAVLSTRLFSFQNSCSILESNIAALQKAIVSVGYTAIEVGTPQEVKQVAEACGRYRDFVLRSNDPDLISSLVCLELHLALHLQKFSGIHELAKITLGVNGNINRHPGAAYNAIHNAVILGYYYYYSNDLERARSLFEQGDMLMRVCVENHPRANYEEILKVVALGFFCWAGALAAQGLELPASIPEKLRAHLTLEGIWTHSARTIGPEVNARLLRSFKGAVQAPVG